MVVVNGAKGRLSSLLRRGLLVAAMAGLGWLLSVVFSAAAVADELPGDDTTSYQSQSGGGLLGGLLGGVTNTLTGLTDTVTHLAGAVLGTTSSLLSPVINPPDQQPILDMPEILPAPTDGSSNPGSATPGRSDAVVVAAPVVAPAPPVAPPLAPVIEVAPVRAAVKPTAVAPPPAPVVQDAGGNAAEHANRGDSNPQPVKAPAPNSPGSTASSAHDSFGGARGTHGVLTVQATLHPADAGFTSRSRAVNAAGRSAGLPACSPD